MIRLKCENTIPAKSFAILDFYNEVNSYTLANGSQATDEGDGLTGIPVAGHTLTATDYVRIVGTTNYDGEHPIYSATAGKIVIEKMYVSEIFTGTEKVYKRVNSWDESSQSFVANKPNEDNLPFSRVAIIPKAISVNKPGLGYTGGIHTVEKTGTVVKGTKVGTKAGNWQAQRHTDSSFHVIEVIDNDLVVRPSARDERIAKVFIGSHAIDEDDWARARLWGLNKQGDVLRGDAVALTPVYCIALDDSGNVYLGTYRGITGWWEGGGPSTPSSYDRNVWKMDKYFKPVWQYLRNTTSVTDITVLDSHPYIIAGTEAMKMKSDGTGILQVYHNDENGFYCIAVDGDGFVYCGGEKVVQWVVVTSFWKFSNAGVLQCSYNTGGIVKGVGVDADGNIHLASNETDEDEFDATVHKLNSDCSQIIWTYNTHAKKLFKLRVDEEGNVYVAIERVQVGGVWRNIVKLNSNGEEEWVYDTGGLDVFDIDVDDNGIVYAAGTWNNYASVWVLDKNGNLLWKFDPGGNSVYSSFSIAVTP